MSKAVAPPEAHVGIATPARQNSAGSSRSSRERWRAVGWPYTRVILGLLLLTAALVKAWHARLLPPARPFLTVMQVECEWLLAAWLLCGWRPRLSRRVAIGAFGMFVATNVYQLARGETSCGCFGPVDVSPAYTLALDLLAVVALLAFRPSPIAHSGGLPVPTRFGVHQAQAAMVLILTSALGLGWAVASAQPSRVAEDGELVGDSRLVNVEPMAWKGKAFPLLVQTNIPAGISLSNGRWLVVLYRHDCPTCRKAILSLTQSYQQAHLQSGLNIALVEVPPLGPENHLADIADPSMARGHLSADRDWRFETPVALKLDGGVVKDVQTGESAALISGGTQRLPTAKSQRPAESHLATTLPSFDLGYVAPGSRHSLTYILSNPAERPLAIRQIKPECECTRIEDPPRQIPAKGDAQMSVLFEAPDEAQAYAKRIFVKTDDDKNPDLTLEVRARIGMPLEIEPLVLDIGDGRKNAGERVEVINRSKEPIRLLFGTSDRTGCAAIVPRKPIQPGERATIPIRIDEALRPGEATQIQIRTSSTEQPTIQIRLVRSAGAAANSSSSGR